MREQTLDVNKFKTLGRLKILLHCYISLQNKVLPSELRIHSRSFTPQSFDTLSNVPTRKNETICTLVNRLLVEIHHLMQIVSLEKPQLWRTAESKTSMSKLHPLKKSYIVNC